MTDPRYLAVKLLNKTFSSGSYSNIQLSAGLDSSDLDDRGKKLCSALYYGVIERKITLDYIISGLSSRPISKLDDIIINILRCGIYQIMFMDSIPDNAAVNESVALAKKFRKTSAAGMVNAVLRNFIRGGKTYKQPKNDIQKLSVELSAPEDMIKEYRSNGALDVLSKAYDKKSSCLRVNPLKCTFTGLCDALDGDASAVEPKLFNNSCVNVENCDPVRTDAFKKGFFHVQSAASQYICKALAPDENDRVLDLCAAPGGKTFTLAEMMQGRGEVWAFDLHEKRVKLIRDGAERLGLANIKASAGDASKFDETMPKFSKILCDVPCSGLAVVGSKPEIKYKKLSDFAGLPEIQYNIAQNALNYLEAGGELVYSTCTVRKEENEEVCERLLREHPELEIVPLPETSLPSDRETDRKYRSVNGFFVAKFHLNRF
jgi:16S rRNA (cytosine967-C5)-methyltransferase